VFEIRQLLVGDTFLSPESQLLRIPNFWLWLWNTR